MIFSLFKTQLFIPDAHHTSIFNVNYHKLYQEGIRLLLVDLDNTLIPYDIDILDETLAAFFLELSNIGFDVVILSNNKQKRVAPFAQAAQLPFIFSAKKPFHIGFKKALKLAKQQTEKEAVCVIGDQLMTDVFGAKRIGFKVILVNPIKRRTEKWYTKVNRFAEQFMLKRIAKKYPEAYQNLNLKDRFND